MIMNYNRRTMQKRGGRIKNNFIDNIQLQRSTATNSFSYAAQLRPNIPNSFNPENIQNISDFYDDHKTLYILCKYYLGNFVTIKTESEEFNGVLKAVSPNGDFCLTEATVFVNNNEFVNRNEKFKMIPIKDIKIVEAKNVESNHNLCSLDHDKILTDEEIVKRRRSNQAIDANSYNDNGSLDIELTPFYDSSVPLEDNCLNASKVGAHWFPPEEMFEKNKISFNVKSTYNENLEGYTTQLHKEDPEYERDLIIAQKKALEIEKDRDIGHDDLENGDEENEEVLFCSIVRTSESHKNIIIPENKVTNSQAKSAPQQIRNRAHYIDHNLSPTQDAIDQKHNLNPNAREFTPISTSVSYSDVNNISMYMNSMSIQNQNSYSNIIHPQSFIPYSIPVMFPHHMPNSVPIIQNSGMDQFLISRQNIIPNYSMSPFFVPNQCQIAFDPSLMTPVSNSRFENNNFDAAPYSTHNDMGGYDRGDNAINEFPSRSEQNNLVNMQTNEDMKREESDNLKKPTSNEEYDKMMRDPGACLSDSQYSAASNHNYELSESSMVNYQKMNASTVSSHNQRMYSQVVAGGNSQAYILPANIAHGIRNIGNYPQMVPNQISYIPNYFPRQPSLVAPIHQVIPNMMSTAAAAAQIHQNMPVQMKPIAPPTPNFQAAGFQPNPSFVPVMNAQLSGQNFHTIIPSYPPPMSAPINAAHLQIPFQQFSQFITPIPSCNYFTPMQFPPSQPN